LPPERFVLQGTANLTKAFLRHNIFQSARAAMFPRKPETYSTEIEWFQKKENMIRNNDSMIMQRKTLATVELFQGQTTRFHVSF